MESSDGNLRTVAFTSGKYEVVARLGLGGMAQVFLAVVRGLGGFNKLVVIPHNLFVTHDGQVKVFDFGVAKAESRLEGTDTGVLKGKLGYMSPEQAAGIAVDRRADVFSAGVVLWELLTLRQLVTRDSNAAALRQVLHGSAPELPSTLPDVDDELRSIVSMALRRDRGRRFQSALEMREALLGYLQREPYSLSDLAKYMHEQFHSARAELQQRIQDTIFPAGGADPVLSVSETEVGDDPLLFGVSDELLPVLDSGSYSVAPPHDATEVLSPTPNSVSRVSNTPLGIALTSQSAPPAPPVDRPRVVVIGGLCAAALGALLGRVRHRHVVAPDQRPRGRAARAQRPWGFSHSGGRARDRARWHRRHRAPQQCATEPRLGSAPASVHGQRRRVPRPRRSSSGLRARRSVGHLRHLQAPSLGRRRAGTGEQTLDG